MNNIKFEKLKMQTPNICDENIKKLKELFPQIISEDKIDFDILRQLLSENIVEADDERYRLDWVGKKRSLLKANTPINKTLRPCIDESVDFENTKNLYIEGDNFEVLKLLQESYLNKIKMIYIDPPYNTGKDFVYRDNFTQNKADFEDEIGLRDEEGNKLFKNTDSNGRFHSDWLSMMYERLIVARDLLKDDGVILISIGDDEIDNLRKVCTQVYGENNFIAQLVWNCSTGGGIRPKHFSITHEYILVYSKNKNKLDELNATLSKEAVNQYKLSDDKGLYREKDFVFKNVSTNINQKYEIECPNGDIVKPKNGYIYRFIKETFIEAVNNDLVVFKKTNNGPLINLDGSQASWNIYIKKYLGDGKGSPVTSLPRDLVGIYNNGTSAVQNLFENKRVFENVKSVELIVYLIEIFLTNKNDLILDFFSGSSTTAHAVMQLNAQDGGNRKFIMVQIPEFTDEKSEAFKAGYKNICEIGKERIRRAGKKILEENKNKDLSSLDIGFRVLKTDSTNFKDVYYHPNNLNQNQLKMFETNIKEDRSDLDLLFSIMLDLGIELSLKINTKIVSNKKLYLVENSELIVCFEENINLEIIQAIKEEKPLKVVLKDGCFANDTEKINAILELSLITSISVI